MTSPDLVLNDRYQLVREIARGGMAVIWEARDAVLDRRVAVKILHPQFAADPEFLERFRREARAAANLAHPNIVAIYDVGQDRASGTPFIVMELVDGEDLKEVIRRSAPLPSGAIREIGAALAGALEYAHRRGVVHRDVKPHNVLIDDEGRVRLTDFGIAQALAASGLTRTGAVMGSVHYLAPELARGQPATPAVDLYGLGAVLYEMATGRVPFTGETDLAVALAHAEQAPAPPRSLNASLAPDLDRTILRALAKSPADRFASAAEFARALKAPSVDQPTARLPGAQAGAAGRAESAPPPARARPSAAREVVTTGGRARSRVVPPPRRGPGNGFPVLLLVLAAIMLALGAGFFGLASLNREGSAPPTPAPTAQAPSSPTAKPAAVASAQPTATPGPTEAPTPTPEPSKPPASPTPRPATPTVRAIAVPSLIGKAMNDALAAVQASGLTATVKGVNVNQEQGRVVAQTPDAGATLPPGSTIAISVATGQVVIPNVAGRTREQALKLLADAGLRPRVKDVRSSQPKGTAVGTTPEAGETVPRGFEMDLLLSGGR